MSRKARSEQPIKEPKPIKKLSRKDLLEVSQNISQYYAPKVSLSTQKLVLLPIDPNHVYAYWNLIENQPDTISPHLNNDGAKSQWTLKVFSHHKNRQARLTKKPVTEISINELQAGRKIQLPMANKETIYSAQIGRETEEMYFTPLIRSNNTSPLYGNILLMDKVEKDPHHPKNDATFDGQLFYKNVSASGKGIAKALK